MEAVKHLEGFKQLELKWMENILTCKNFELNKSVSQIKQFFWATIQRCFWEKTTNYNLFRPASVQLQDWTLYDMNYTNNLVVVYFKPSIFIDTYTTKNNVPLNNPDPFAFSI